MEIKLIVAIIIFGAALVAHLLRLIFKIPATLGSFRVPLYFSLIAVITLTILIFWLLK